MHHVFSIFQVSRDDGQDRIQPNSADHFIDRAVDVTVTALVTDPFYSEMVRFPRPNQLPHRKFARSRKLGAFRQACGAIDGTLITAHPPSHREGNFRDRKGGLSWNVLGICDLDRRLCYVNAGWEGPEPDISIWYDCLRHEDIPIPQGYYLLGDAGFTLRCQVLTPYNGTAYHLAAWKRSRRQPATREEVYNHQHSSLRMPIEQVWGIMKARFKALRAGTYYAPAKQVQVIYALCALQNFMSDNKDDCEPVPDDQDLLSGVGLDPDEPVARRERNDPDARSDPMVALREKIADDNFARWEVIPATQPE